MKGADVRSVIAAFATAVALSCAAGAGAIATAKILDLERNVIGKANFQAATHGVLIEVDVKGLPPGPHAIFLHSTASCNPGTKFTSAGPIFNLEGDRPHGYLAKGGPRTGDLPVQFAAADGTLHASMASTAISLGNGTKSIFDRDGVSIIIHAKGDDYFSQPDGGAGARIACGTVIRTVAPGPQKRAKKHK
jgi:superoxide dismutase, Cu-Zn family